MDWRLWLFRTRWLLAGLGLLALARGVYWVRAARGVRFFRQRYQRLLRGWRWIGLALILEIAAWLVVPMLVRPASVPQTQAPAPPPTPLGLPPTPSPTPTATAPPTPTITPTLAGTPTPHIPPPVLELFESTATPPPEARFSPLTFTVGLDPETFRPLRPGEVFQNPVGHMYALFSYDGMADGVQWTALWYRDGQLVHFESKPWDGGTGGWGYTDWNPEPAAWQPGVYTVYIFVGTELKAEGSFRVEGAPPTATFTPRPTEAVTATPTATPAPSATPTPTFTPSPTRTPFTPVPTPTP